MAQRKQPVFHSRPNATLLMDIPPAPTSTPRERIHTRTKLIDFEPQPRRNRQGASLIESTSVTCPQWMKNGRTKGEPNEGAVKHYYSSWRRAFLTQSSHIELFTRE